MQTKLRHSLICHEWAILQEVKKTDHKVDHWGPVEAIFRRIFQGGGSCKLLNLQYLKKQQTNIKPVSVSIITGVYNAILVNNGLHLIITTPSQAMELNTSG